MKRLGKFWVAKQLVEDASGGAAQVLAALEFVPVRVNYFWEREAYQYLGHSPHFREVETNGQTPEYAIVVHAKYHEGAKTIAHVEAYELDEVSIGPPTEAERAEVLANINRFFQRGENNGDEKQPG